MTLTTTTEHLLSKADLVLAEEIAFAWEDLEGQAMNICFKVFKACETRDERSNDAFLAAALPRLSKSKRKDVRYAGAEVARRRAALSRLDYGWTTLAEIHALPAEHKDWAYEEKRTRQEIRDYKRLLKQPNNASVTPQEAQAFNDMTDVVEQLLNENEQLRKQLNDSQHFPTPAPQHDPSISTPSNPQVLGSARLEVGDEAVDDFNRVHRLLDEVRAIEHKYFCKGIWRKQEWESLYGAHYAASATSNAQRNYKSGSESGPVIDIR